MKESDKAEGGAMPRTPRDDSDEFDEKPKLSELAHNGAPIAAWPFVQPLSDVRIYYRLNEGERNGFDYYAIEYLGCWIDDRPEGFDHPEARFSTLFHGWAAFDGIRHLYVRQGRDAGYIYYPHIEQLITVLAALRALEVAHCRDPASG